MTSTASLEGVKKTVFFPLQVDGWGLKHLIGLVATSWHFC